MIDTSLPPLPTSHYFEDDSSLVPSVGIYNDLSIKTNYQTKKSHQVWLGRVGEPIGCLRKDSNILRMRGETDINIDTIREKIAADLFRYLGKDAFIFPEAYLSCQQLYPAEVVSNMLANYYAYCRDIKKCLRVMYKTDYPWEVIERVYTRSKEGKKINLRKFIKLYHRFPDKVFYDDKDKNKEIEIPLLGGIELLAAIKVLGDTDGFGKSGENVRIAWESKDNQVCAARLVKYNTGHPFRFVEEGYAHAQKLSNLNQNSGGKETDPKNSSKNTLTQKFEKRKAELVGSIEEILKQKYGKNNKDPTDRLKNILTKEYEENKTDPTNPPEDIPTQNNEENKTDPTNPPEDIPTQNSEEKKTDPMNPLKNIDLDKKGKLSIHWEALTSDQQSKFQETLNKMITDLARSNDRLYFCFHRNDSFNRGKTIKFPSSIAKLLTSQMKCWLEFLQELYCKQSKSENLDRVLHPFSLTSLENFISSKPNLRQTFKSSEFVIKTILHQISPTNSVLRIPEEGATRLIPSGKRGTLAWNDEQECKWTGNIRKPIKGLGGAFCEREDLLKRVSKANVKVIIKKVTADLFRFLGEGHFLTPDTCLLDKRTPRLNKGNVGEILIEKLEPFQMMTKKIERLSDLSKATTLDGSQEISIRSFIEKNRRPPEFILTKNKVLVPLEGMMELLAALRILNDTYIFDDSEKRVRFVWRKDSSDLIVSAQVAKIKLSNFKPHGLTPYKIAKKNFSRLMNNDKDHIHSYLKSIRVARSDGLGILWESLTTEQKDRFKAALNKMKKKLSSKALLEIFTQHKTFKFAEVNSESFNSRVNNLIFDTRLWIKLLHLVYSNDQYEEFQKKMESLIKKKDKVIDDGLQFDDPYCKNDQEFKLLQEESVNKIQTGIEGFYQRASDPNSKWIARKGQPNSLLISVSLLGNRPKLQKIADTIREKIAFDLFSRLSDRFVTPETILSFQNQIVEDNALPDAEINRDLYLMSKCLEDFQDLKTAKTKFGKSRTMKVLYYIKNNHRFPETIYTPTKESVPIMGLPELLAAIKILGDRDGFGKDGNHMGFQWIRDASGTIVGAKAVKMNLQGAFEFSEDFQQKFLNSEKEFTDKELMDEGLKDIQVAKDSSLTIHWKELKTEQQQQFLEALKKMCQILKSKTTLNNCFYRNRAFRVSRSERFPKKQVKDLMAHLRKWVNLQEKLYLNEV